MEGRRKIRALLRPLPDRKSCSSSRLVPAAARIKNRWDDEKTIVNHSINSSIGKYWNARDKECYDESEEGLSVMVATEIIKSYLSNISLKSKKIKCPISVFTIPLPETKVLNNMRISINNRLAQSPIKTYRKNIRREFSINNSFIKNSHKNNRGNFSPSTYLKKN